MQVQIHRCTSQLPVSAANSILIAPTKNKEVFNVLDTMRPHFQCEGADMDTFFCSKKQLPESLQNNIKQILLRRILRDFFFICHIYPPFTRKRIALPYFARDVRTRLGVAITVVSGAPVFHIKAGRPVKCLAQGHNKRTCRLVLLEQCCV